MLPWTRQQSVYQLPARNPILAHGHQPLHCRFIAVDTFGRALKIEGWVYVIIWGRVSDHFAEAQVIGKDDMKFDFNQTSGLTETRVLEEFRMPWSISEICKLPSDALK